METKRVTKRDMVDYCLKSILEMWDKKLPFDERTKVFYKCMEESKKHGYVGAAFDEIWNKAVDMHGRILNIHPDSTI